MVETHTHIVSGLSLIDSEEVLELMTPGTLLSHACGPVSHKVNQDGRPPTLVFDSGIT